MKKRGFNLLLGLLILLAGFLILLNNFEIIDISIWEVIGTYWPVLIIGWGIDVFLRKGFRGKLINGLILVGLGLVLLGRNLEFYSLDFSVIWNVFWPIVIMYTGIIILQGVFKKGGSSWAVMGAVERKEKGWLLESSNYMALMGGVDLDIGRAEFTKNKIVLNLSAVMGGIEITVPEEIEIECKGTALLGGISCCGGEIGGIFGKRDFHCSGDENNERKLVIKSRVLMGGIDIINS